MDKPGNRRAKETPHLAHSTIELGFLSDLPVPDSMCDVGGTPPPTLTRNVPSFVPIVEAPPVVPAPTEPVPDGGYLLMNVRTGI